MKVEQRFIAKIQTPLMTNDPNAGALVYDRTRKKFNQQIPIDNALLSVMRGRPKAFFWVELHKDDTLLHIGSEVKDPGW